MSDNLFHKTMRGNFSQSPHDHEDAIKILAEKNYSFIPEIYHFDNKKYCCQRIEEGVTLKQYLEETADFDVASNVIVTITKIFLETSKNHKNNLYLIPDDVHDENIILDKQKNVFLVDLDMFGWWPKNLVFQKLGVAISSVSHSINYTMLYYEKQQMIKTIDELSDKLNLNKKFEVYKPSAM